MKNNKVQRTKNKETKNLLSEQSAFTLVELLVVIGIITLIMVAVFPNFNAARQRARDSQRKSDLKNLQTALDLYKMDQNPPNYPTTGALGESICSACWASDGNCGESGGNIYIKKVPCDPVGSTNPTPYIYTQNGSDSLKYTLSACLENAADTDRDTNNVTGCNVSYTVNEP